MKVLSRSCLVILMLLAAVRIFAQTPNDAGVRLGVGGGYSWTLDRVDGQGVVPVADSNCASFTGGNGGGFVVALSADWRFKDSYGVLFRGGFASSPINMNSSIGATTKNASGVIVPLTIDQTLAIPGNTLAFDILPEKRFSMFRVFVGGTLAYLYNMKWDVVSSIEAPPNVTYSNGLRTTTLLNQSAIPNLTPLLFGPTAGLGIDLPLSPKLSLSPELSATYFLNSIQSGESWKRTSVSLIASIRYSLGCNTPGKHSYEAHIDTLRVDHANPSGHAFVIGIPRTTTDLAPGRCAPDTIESIMRTDTLFKTCPTLVANVQMFGIDEQGHQSTSPNQPIHIEMEYVLDKIPILPYIFFDSGSSQIPARYLAHPNIDDPGKATSVELSHDVLDLVGQRLQSHPRAKLTIHGYIDSTELKWNPGVGAARAKAVGDYLAQHWNIDQRRIQVDQQADKLPPSPTISELAAGRAENRRVELVSTNMELLAPEDRDSILEPGIIDPPLVLVSSSESSTEAVDHMRKTVRMQSEVLYDSTSNTLPRDNVISITPAMAVAASNGDELTSSLVLSNACTSDVKSEATVPVQKDTSKFSVRRFTLVNFRIGSADLASQDTSMLRGFFTGLQPSDEISIKGYTDYLGNSDENKQLSKARADAIAKYWQHSWRIGTIVSDIGVANFEYVYGISSYNTPEERFLSRTVVIEVRHRR